MTTVLVILGLIVVTLLVLVGIYNRLIALRQNTNQAFADIDVQMKQRHDLIPNLVETVKGYAAHEKETLDAVIKARNQAMAAGSGTQGQAQAEGMLGAALGKLIAVAEAYPDLKANTNFQQLMSELSDVENKIAASRRFLNNAVGEYNTAIEQFPAVLFAPLMGFGKKTFYDVGEEARVTLDQAPNVKF